MLNGISNNKRQEGAVNLPQPGTSSKKQKTSDVDMEPCKGSTVVCFSLVNMLWLISCKVRGQSINVDFFKNSY